MSQCNKCEVHNEVNIGYDENTDEFLAKQCFNTAIWNNEEVEESYNILIKEDMICEHCLYEKYNTVE